jgi:hypothetical protein
LRHRGKSFWNILYYCFVTFSWITGIIIILLSTANQAIKNEWTTVTNPSALGDIFGWLNQYSWFIAPGTLLYGGLKFTTNRIGQPWIYRHVHTILDSAREYVFSDRSSMLHQHKVTLYKRVTWYWKFKCKPWSYRYFPWSGWLIPIVRSGHTQQNPKAVFMAPTNNADRAEGIAGKTWLCNKMVSIYGLPDVSGNCSEGATVHYAQSTNVTPNWVSQNKPPAKSLCGIPVEVEGEVWGVMVFDSREDKEIPKTRIDTFVKLQNKSLTKILERKYK